MAHLSPHEATFRQIATGSANRDKLREDDIRLLTALGLVHEVDGELSVTAVGAERCAGSTTSVLRQERRRR